MKHLETAQKHAVAKWGRGWSLLSADQRAGAVALELVTIIAGQEATEGSHASRIIGEADKLVVWAATL